jgi:hypothetical protein
VAIPTIISYRYILFEVENERSWKKTKNIKDQTQKIKYMRLRRVERSSNGRIPNASSKHIFKSPSRE